MNRSIRSLRRTTLSGLIQAGLSSVFAVSLTHATCTVNSSTDDPGEASAKVTAVPPNPWSGANASIVTLRDCIVAANLMTGSTGAPTSSMDIRMAAIAGQTIVLQDSLPMLFNNTIITAGTNGPVTIDGGGVHRIFFVSGLPPIPVSGTPDPDGTHATTVVLTNLILKDGKATGGKGGGGGMGAGGALFVNKAASVSLTHVGFAGNAAQGGAGFQDGMGGGGMGLGRDGNGGGGLSDINSGVVYGYGYGGGGIGTADYNYTSGGFGGSGLGQISANQNFNPADFNVDSGLGTSGSLIGGGGAASPGVSGGFGGFGGGGGGAHGNSAGAGGFGGGGGSSTHNVSSHNSGSGGFGGGGGSGDLGGYGGFGGGGGGGDFGAGAAGGVGGGAGENGGYGYALSGGGAGFGGAVFVRSGGTFSVNENTSGGLSGGSVSAGSDNGFQNGAAAGNGLFVMSGATAKFSIAGIYTIADNIADDSPLSLPAGNSYTPGNGAGAAITKTGVGSLILSGNNTYAGMTAVNAGTLGGKGSIAGPVTLASGAQIAPGDPAFNGGVGTLSTGALAWNAGGAMAFQLGSTSADSDLLVVNGALTNGVKGNYIFHFGMGDRPPIAGTEYVLIDAVGGNGFSAADFSYTFDNTYDALTGFFSTGSCNGASCVAVKFTVTAVTSDRIFANSFD